ncbi:MAG: RCC1 domain-containing protein [Gemmatimonadales bacterium]
MDAGSLVTCAVTTADRAYCWGNNLFGQLGDGSTAVYRPTPGAVAGQRRFDHVNAGSDYICGVTLAGLGFCWGRNDGGRLGDGTTTDRRTPVLVGNGLVLAQVGAGLEHTCGATPENRAYCWGTNEWGQLGDGTTTRRLRPVAVAGPM